MQLRRENLAEFGNTAASLSEAKKRALLQHVTDLFLRTLDRQSAGDTEVFGEVLDKIAYQLDDAARTALSEQLSTLDKVPIKLVCQLASDVIQVAKPVLELSPCLDDEFLARTVRTQSQDHIFAVAGRPLLTAIVTDEIVIHGEHYVLYRVTANPGASFSHQGLEALTANAANNRELGHALSTRQDFPQEFKDRIGGSQNEIRPAEFFALDFDKLGSESGGSGLFSEVVDGAQEPITYAEEDVDETILLYSAEVKDLEETSANLAKIAGIPQSNAEYLLLKGEIPALAIVCKASQVKTGTFEALVKFRINLLGLDPSILTPNVERYRNLGIRTAQRLASALKVKLAESLSA